MSVLFFICWTCTSLYSFVYIYQHYKSIPSSNQTSQWKIPRSWMISPAVNYKHPFSLGISIQPPGLMTLETTKYYFGSRKQVKSEFSLQLWPSTVHTMAYKKLLYITHITFIYLIYHLTTQLQDLSHSQINGHFRNLNWRYLPYIRPIYTGIYPQNMA